MPTKKTATKNTSSVVNFKGNKQSLPSKLCVVCGRPMVWRKRWAKTWNEVLYCSQACRQQKRTFK